MIQRSSTLAIAGLVILPSLAGAAQTPSSKAAAPKANQTAPATKADSDPDLALANKAALAWLQLADSAKFDATWDEASKAFQQVQKKADWSKGLSGARGALGAFVSRTFLNEEIRTTLPNLPPGKYVTVRFKTTFAKRKDASESVTLLRDGARGFRMIAYFLG